MAVLTASRNVSVLVASSHKRLLPRERKKALITSAFFVSACFTSALLSFLFPASAQARCPQLPGGFSARVEHVYDGDTVLLTDGRRVRLIGVNTPELGRDGRPNEAYAQAAQRWLQQHADEQQVYLLPGVESHDRYGRLLAHLYLSDGRLAAEELVRAGLGYALAVGGNSRLAACLFAAERDARQQHDRLWQQPPVAAAAIDRAGFAMVRGHITRMTSTRRGLYVDLDDQVALFLSQALVAEVQAQNWRTGQPLEVRGWVVDRLQRQSRLSEGQQRWLLKVTHKYHLKLH